MVKCKHFKLEFSTFSKPRQSVYTNTNLACPCTNVIFNIKVGCKKQRIRNCNKVEEGKNSNGIQNQNWVVQIYCLYVGLILPELLAQLHINPEKKATFTWRNMNWNSEYSKEKKIQLSSVYMSKIISLMFFLIHGFYFVIALDGVHRN